MNDQQTGQWYRLTFGKHRNRQLAELLEHDQKYLIYLCSDKGRKYLPTHARVYVDQAIGAVRICFGRHKNRTYAEIRDRHPGYLNWLRSTPGNEWLDRFLTRFLD